MLTLGQSLNGKKGKYKVNKFYEEGGLGYIWLAKCIDGKYKGSNVIIKEPKTSGHKKTKEVEYIDMEINFLKKFNHKHIVNYYDEATIKGQNIDIPILIQEFIDNSDTLSHVINKIGPLNEGQVKSFLIDLLNVLKLIHSKDYIWRDLNPNNILVKNNDVKNFCFIDFGTCKKCDTTGKKNFTEIEFKGYTAPELAERGIAHVPGDIYSLACIGFLCVTGIDPAPRASIDPFVKNELTSSSISDEFKKILLKGLDVDPSNRYQTVLEFKNALRGTPLHRVDRPHLIMYNKKFPFLGDEVRIGRDPSSNQVFLLQENDSRIDMAEDIERYISRLDPSKGLNGHIKVKKKGKSWILERYGKNKVSIFRNSQMIEVKKGGSISLKDGDVIALAWSKLRGTYMVMNFKKS